jgi:hypothetical protein
MSAFAATVTFLEDKHKAYVKRVSTDTESFEVGKLQSIKLNLLTYLLTYLFIYLSQEALYIHFSSLVSYNKSVFIIIAVM